MAFDASKSPEETRSEVDTPKIRMKGWIIGEPKVTKPTQVPTTKKIILISEISLKEMIASLNDIGIVDFQKQLDQIGILLNESQYFEARGTQQKSML